MSNEEKLMEAKRLILEVRDTFNNTQERCSCCGAERFVNWNQRQMRDQLNGAVTRIDRAARSLE
jgi:transposase